MTYYRQIRKQLLEVSLPFQLILFRPETDSDSTGIDIMYYYKSLRNIVLDEKAVIRDLKRHIEGGTVVFSQIIFGDRCIGRRSSYLDYSKTYCASIETKRQ